MSKELDEIAKRFDAANPDSVELHGSPMLQGRGEWKMFPRELREQAMRDALNIAYKINPPIRIFGVVVKKAVISPCDHVEYAFEQVTNRFDRFLGRIYKRDRNTQRGLILFDKSVHERTLQTLAHGFRNTGHKWGILRNLAEVPLFIDSQASRLIQLADLIAYALFRNREKEDGRFYNVIKDRFDREGSVVHGLYVRE